MKGIGLALLLFAPDAFAWGLETHLFYAQWVLGALPFADAELRAAALRFPRLVLAGACLPDLAVAGKFLGIAAFRRAHSWSTLRRMTSAPPTDEARALAIGYASHLVSDVVAHNDFVPEHEARIGRVRHVTHAIAEFAMDEHIRPSLDTGASAALEADRAAVIAFVAGAFRCDEAVASRGVSMLSSADRHLRASPLPRLCARIVRGCYRDPAYRFERYIAAVKVRLGELEAALSGEYCDWVSSDPEGRAGDGDTEKRPGQHVARVMQA